MAACVRQPVASTSRCLLSPLKRHASASASNADFLAKAVKQAVKEMDVTDPVRIVNARDRQTMLMDTLSELGSTQTRNTGYRPAHALERPAQPYYVALDHILAATLHLGHRSIFYNRHCSPYIYGRRNKIDIIDARQTLAHLRRAAEVVRGVVEHNGVVVFMSGLKGTESAVKMAAEACGPNGYAVTTYKEGFLLNAEKVYDGYDFNSLRPGSAKAEDKVTAGMLMPSLVVCLTPRSHLDAIAEANIIRCPTIGLVDSDTDPRLVTYSIPGNDDGVRGIQLIAGILGRAGKDGLERRRNKGFAEEGNRLSAERAAQTNALLRAEKARSKAYELQKVLERSEYGSTPARGALRRGV